MSLTKRSVGVVIEGREMEVKNYPYKAFSFHSPAKDERDLVKGAHTGLILNPVPVDELKNNVVLKTIEENTVEDFLVRNSKYKALEDKVTKLETEKNERHNRLLFGQLAFCLERNIVKHILENRSPLALRSTSLLSIYYGQMQLSNSEESNWQDFRKKFGSGEDLELFMHVLLDFKENRLSDAHPTQTIDEKDVDANIMADLIEKFYTPEEKERKKMAHLFVTILKDYKKDSPTKFLQF